MPIAIDAMGGDFAPRNPVRAAIKAVNEDGIDAVLVGDEAAIKQELDKGGKYDARKIEIHHTTQVVEMDESAVVALKRKKDSSMRVAYNLHKEGRVGGVVSAGHSGAMLSFGHFVLRPIKGIDRPCISALLPSMKGRVLLLDAGANLECESKHLIQFALLGSVYMRYIHSVNSPRISLLNVGSEEGKGHDLVKRTYEALQNSSLNFVGNVEGKNFFLGEVDVVVTDGFSGNVLLKSVQGAANFVTHVLREEVEKSFISKLGAALMNQTFKKMKKRINYAEYGGAPLLGLKGVGIVCHGNSNPEAIQSGIRFAKWAEDVSLVTKMEEYILKNKEILQTSLSA